MDSKFYIIYPSGDKSKLSVVEIPDSMSYELSDYSVASRNDFRVEDEARVYARELAKKHHKLFVGDEDGEEYLD